MEEMEEIRHFRHLRLFYFWKGKNAAQTAKRFVSSREIVP